MGYKITDREWAGKRSVRPTKGRFGGKVQSNQVLLRFAQAQQVVDRTFTSAVTFRTAATEEDRQAEGRGFSPLRRIAALWFRLPDCRNGPPCDFIASLNPAPGGTSPDLNVP
jgi:hypothetical protein